MSNTSITPPEGICDFYDPGIGSCLRELESYDEPISVEAVKQAETRRRIRVTIRGSLERTEYGDWLQDVDEVTK